jgi:hypothetical protein
MYGHDTVWGDAIQQHCGWKQVYDSKADDENDDSIAMFGHVFRLT